MGPIFRRNLTESKETHLFSLLDTHSQVSISEDYSDNIVWNAFQDGVFSVSSFFTGISRSAHSSSPLFKLWKIITLPRVISFGWLALHKAILTMDDLHFRKRITINACPMCLADEETIDHLMSSCRVAQARWRLVLRWLDCSWVFPRQIGELFEAIAFAMCLS